MVREDVGCNVGIPVSVGDVDDGDGAHVGKPISEREGLRVGDLVGEREGVSVGDFVGDDEAAWAVVWGCCVCTTWPRCCF